MIFVSQSYRVQGDCALSVRLRRGTTNIFTGDYEITEFNDVGADLSQRWSLSYLDNTTAVGNITYSTQFKKTLPSTPANRLVAAQGNAQTSTIQIIEIL